MFFGTKDKVLLPKYLGLGKAKRKVCLIAYEKEEHEGNMLNASRGGGGWMLAYGHKGLVVNTENNGNHEVLMLGGCDILITNLWLIISNWVVRYTTLINCG
jgi:hypothetical protein